MRIVMYEGGSMFSRMCDIMHNHTGPSPKNETDDKDLTSEHQQQDKFFHSLGSPSKKECPVGSPCNSPDSKKLPFLEEWHLQTQKDSVEISAQADIRQGNSCSLASIHITTPKQQHILTEWRSTILTTINTKTTAHPNRMSRHYPNNDNACYRNM
jgi:hypothetical protein